MPRNASRRTRKSSKTRGGYAFLSKKFHFNGVSIGGKRRKTRRMRGGNHFPHINYDDIKKEFEKSNQMVDKSYVE